MFNFFIVSMFAPMHTICRNFHYKKRNATKQKIYLHVYYFILFQKERHERYKCTQKKIEAKKYETDNRIDTERERELRISFLEEMNRRHSKG